MKLLAQRSLLTGSCIIRVSHREDCVQLWSQYMLTVMYPHAGDGEPAVRLTFSLPFDYSERKDWESYSFKWHIAEYFADEFERNNLCTCRSEQVARELADH